MTTPQHFPEGLSPIEAVLYEYVTNPQAGLPNPLAFLDEEPVHWTANNGPHTSNDAHHILTTPHLLQLLTQLWEEEPPTPEVITACTATEPGCALLTATGHTPPSATPGSKNDVIHISQDDLDTLHLEIAFCLLGHTEESVGYRGDTPGASDLTFRGAPTPTHPTSRRQTQSVWTYKANATTTHPEAHLRITQKDHKTTGEPQLVITPNTTADTNTLLATGHTTFTLTWTHTTNDLTETHTDTQTIDADLDTAWTIPTPHTPNTTTRITLTPTHDAAPPAW